MVKKHQARGSPPLSYCMYISLLLFGDAKIVGYLAKKSYPCIVKIDGDIESNKTFYNNTKTKLDYYD